MSGKCFVNIAERILTIFGTGKPLIKFILASIPDINRKYLIGCNASPPPFAVIIFSMIEFTAIIRSLVKFYLLITAFNMTNYMMK